MAEHTLAERLALARESGLANGPAQPDEPVPTADEHVSAADSLRRMALQIEYDGRHFHGWQYQERHRTVQHVLGEALAGIVGHAVRLIGCSRTDAGVHALAHVSHFLTTSTIPADRLPLALNSHLPEDVAVHAAADVGSGFHARYGTVAKTYRYLVYQSRTPSALLAGRAAFLPTPLDLGAMQAAAPRLLGEHDFSAFRDASKEEVSPIRRLDRLDVQQDGRLIAIEVCGSGFLYHMVRILAGTLVAVGQGKIDPDCLPDILASRNRLRSGKTMPACGLYLTQVDYDPDPFVNKATVPERWLSGGTIHV